MTELVDGREGKGVVGEGGLGRLDDLFDLGRSED